MNYLMIPKRRIKAWVEEPPYEPTDSWHRFWRWFWNLDKDPFGSLLQKVLMLPVVVPFAFIVAALMQYTPFTIPPTQYVTCQLGSPSNCRQGQPTANEMVVRRVGSIGGYTRWGEEQDVETDYVVQR